MEKYQNLVTRFLKYVKTETRSNEDSQTIPSTANQKEFIAELANELKELGLVNVHISEPSGYVYATLPSNNNNKDVSKVGFIAHVDTADFNAKNVNPKIVEKYDGVSDIYLDEN